MDHIQEPIFEPLEAIIIPTNHRKRKMCKGIETFEDLVKLSRRSEKYANIDMDKLRSISDELHDMYNLIGMKSLKESILHQLLYYLQNLHHHTQDYINTVIYGHAGCGKTTVCKIIGKMFSKLGILSRDSFTIARRDQLIAGYLGQTSIKTQTLLDSCKGGVLFIDEVYSLGNHEGRDIFSKEAIDTINLFLSENRNDFMLIVAGYKEEIDSCFFSVNSGLKRRFQWYHTIEEYSPGELSKIFIKFVYDAGWKFHHTFSYREKLEEFFRENKEYFRYAGGSVENFFTACKLTHSKRVFCLPKYDKKRLKMEDLVKALNILKIEKKDTDVPFGMYV